MATLSMSTTYRPIHQLSLPGQCPHCGAQALTGHYFQLQRETRWTLRLTDQLSRRVSCTACQRECAPATWDKALTEACQAGEQQAVRLPTSFRWKTPAKLLMAVLLLVVPLLIWAISVWMDHQLRTAISQQPQPGDRLLAMPIATDTDPEPKSTYLWLKVVQVGDLEFSLIPYAGSCTTRDDCPKPPESAVQPGLRFQASREDFRKTGNNLNGQDARGAEQHYFVVDFERP